MGRLSGLEYAYADSCLCGLLLSFRSKLADYYHARGYAARKHGNFQAAVEEYSRALALDNSHFKALFNRGFSYDKVNDCK
jgi:tetratricopeptide (TPR) repeat protein